MTVDRASALSALYAIQALLVVGWWLLLFQGDPVRPWFVADDGWSRARAYAPIDLSVVAVPSAVSAYALASNRSWARRAVLATEIGVAVGFVVAVWWIAEPVDRWLGAATMVLMVVANDVMRRIVP